MCRMWSFATVPKLWTGPRECQIMLYDRIAKALSFLSELNIYINSNVFRSLFFSLFFFFLIIIICLSTVSYREIIYSGLRMF
jgi:hypothetical protein